MTKKTGGKQTGDETRFDRQSLKERRLGAGFVPLRRAKLLGYALGVNDDRSFDDSSKFSDQVLEDLKQAVAQNPDDRDANLNLTVTLAQYGFSREAEEAARMAVDRWPEDADARYLYGNLLADRGEDGEAEAQLSKAVSLDTDSPAPAYYLAEFLRRHGRLDEALEYYRKATSSRDVFPCAFSTLEEILTDLDRDREALTVNDALISRAGENAEALISRGWILMKLGRNREVEEVLGRLEHMKLEEEEAGEVESIRRHLTT